MNLSLFCDINISKICAQGGIRTLTSITDTTPSKWCVYHFRHLSLITVQEQQGSNPRPVVLETTTLPTELYSSTERSS